MKILQAINSYVRSFRSGGPVRIMFDYARFLAKMGHRVDVITTNFLDYGKRINMKEEMLEGVNIKYFRNLSDVLSRFNTSLSFELCLHLKKHLKNYDIVHICETRGALPICVYHYSKLYSKPLIHSAFGMLPAKDGIMRKIYDNKCVKPMIRNSSLNLAQTEHEYDEYLKHGGNLQNIKLLPLGVDIESIPNVTPHSFRKALRISSEDRLLLFLGRINPLKGLRRLVNVFYKATKEISNLHLAIVGVDDGALMDTLDHVQSLGMSDKVHFTGPLYNENRFSAYFDADFFIITPTHYEETSLASIEAMACGTPVLVSKEAGIPHLEEYQAGICMEFDEDNFAQALVEVLSDLQILKRMGENAAKLVRDRLNIRNITAQLEKYMTRVS